MKCLGDRAFTVTEVDALVAWCESAMQAIREHAMPVGPPSGWRTRNNGRWVARDRLLSVALIVGSVVSAVHGGEHERQVRFPSPVQQEDYVVC